MSWHLYKRDSRLWSIYWNAQPATTSNNVFNFELTEPYYLSKEEWRRLQTQLLVQIASPDYILNISELWWRNWPSEANAFYTRLTEVNQLEIVVSQECYLQQAPYRMEGYYWLHTQIKPKLDVLRDLIWYHGVDFENVTWITKRPIEPFPDQLFEFNKVALGWYNKELTDAELNKVICEEAWGLVMTDLGHLHLNIPDSSLSLEECWTRLHQVADEYNLEIETTPYSEKPHRPHFVKALANATSDVIVSGWQRTLRGITK